MKKEIKEKEIIEIPRGTNTVYYQPGKIYKYGKFYFDGTTGDILTGELCKASFCSRYGRPKGFICIEEYELWPTLPTNRIN